VSVSGAFPGAPSKHRRRHPQRRPKAGDATFPAAISFGRSALNTEENVIVLLELFFFGAGAIDAFLAPRHVVQRAEARGEGRARVTTRKTPIDGKKHCRRTRIFLRQWQILPARQDVVALAKVYY
jgi:hypothetical protein